MLPPRSAGIFAPSSRIIRTRSRPLAAAKYPASKTTLSRGAARSSLPSRASSFVKRKIPPLQSFAAVSISSRIIPAAAKSISQFLTRNSRRSLRKRCTAWAVPRALLLYPRKRSNVGQSDPTKHQSAGGMHRSQATPWWRRVAYTGWDVPRPST